MKHALFPVLLCAWALTAPHWVHSQKAGGREEPPLPSTAENAPLRVEVWGGLRDLFPIAVPLPLGPERIAAQIQQVEERDFVLSSLFKVLDHRSFLADLAAEGMAIESDPWVQVGAQGVVKSRISKAGGDIRVQFALFEVSRPQRPVLQKTYRCAASKVRDCVHPWVNDVIAHYTGIPGSFGTRLVFSRKTGKGQKHIFTADWTGGGASRVTKNRSINILPAFGPGGAIYYTSFVEGQSWLYRTGQRKAVLSYPGLNMGATFHGNKMAVVLSKDGNPEIYVGNADGTGLRRITHSGAIDVSPTFSPDGSRIAFVSDRGGSPQIYVTGVGGGGATRITYKGTYNQTPSWCPRPGSSLIAFTGKDGGVFDIFTVDAATKEIRRLTQHQGTNMDPAFSPDCRQVAFWSSRGGIFVSNPEGLNQQKVVPGHAETIRWSR